MTNPDLGLTAHLTARGTPVELAVESVTTNELAVQGPQGSDALFDYMVWGLRIGFEELAPVQEKEREAFIPSMKSHRERFASDPSLRAYNALERFSTTERELKGLEKDAALDLGRAEALREARRMLESGHFRVGEVAHRLGFADTAHFSRRYRKFYRCPPSRHVRTDAAETQRTGSGLH